MRNPWEEIPLSAYEAHMSLASVMQLQTLDEMTQDQFDAYSISSVAIFGIAGGNGLGRIPNDKFVKLYGVDINPSYLRAVKRRYPNLDGLLECLCIDLMEQAEQLPNADMVIANLVIEYIGYGCFQTAIRQVDPKYVSCIIQINTEDGWVSDSPYLHLFDGLERIHHQMEERALIKAMSDIDYHPIKTLERPLPNGKKLTRIDFERSPRANRKDAGKVELSGQEGERV